MRRSFIYFFMFLFLLVSSLAISPNIQTQGSDIIIEYPKNDFFKQDSNITLHFHLFNNVSASMNMSLVDCMIHIYNSAGDHILESYLSNDPNNLEKEIDLNSSFTSEDKSYPYIVWCNSTIGQTVGYGFLSTNYEVTGSGYENNLGSGVLVALMLIPLIFGLFLLIGAVSLGDDHIALKIFMFVLSPMMTFISLHFGVISLIKYYGMVDLQDSVGSVVYWMGLIMFVLILYVIGYFIYKAIGAAAQNKNERLKY